jgi:hypothetical protein
MRSKDQGQWRAVDSAVYLDETKLQELLADDPSVIPMREIRQDAGTLIVAIREFGLLGSGKTDIVTFSAEGDIAVVECKLAANMEIKRQVVGQVFEYGAYIWQMSYSDLDKRVRARCDKSLTDLVASKAGDKWDEETFRSNVTDNLSNGSFALIIAVDAINDELARTIQFLNRCGLANYTFHAMEFRKFESGDTEILVPHLHGPSIEDRPSAAGKRRKWNEGDFFEAAKTELDARKFDIVQQLFEWSREHADRVWFGTGTQTGSFTFHYLSKREEIKGAISVFSVYTNGQLAINYGWLKSQLKTATLDEFHQKLIAINGLKKIPADFAKFPQVDIGDAFRDEQDFAAFTSAVEWLGQFK